MRVKVRMLKKTLHQEEFMVLRPKWKKEITSCLQKQHDKGSILCFLFLFNQRGSILKGKLH